MYLISVLGKHFARVDGNLDNQITKKYFYHTDHLGSTVLVTDEQGQQVWSGDYTPFGNQVSKEGELEHVAKFTGKDFDEDTGLYYYNSRWYDQETGRFITEDSYIGDQNDPRTLNLYIYGGNNPLLYVDPSGHSFEYFMSSIYTNLYMKSIANPFSEEAPGVDNIEKRLELAENAKGDSTVAIAQASLSMAGYDLGNAGIDGAQGQKTTQAIIEFQKSAGIKPTGKLTPETMFALTMVTAAGLNKAQIVELGRAANNVPTLVKVDVNYNESPDKGGGPLLDSRIVNNFYSALRELENAGITLTFNDMFRATPKQEHFKQIMRDHEQLGIDYHGLLGVVANVSPHELGRGFDVGGITKLNYNTEKSQKIITTFESYGFKWYGPKDAVHFTAVGTDFSQRNYFQSIWKKDWESTYGAYNCTAH